MRSTVGILKASHLSGGAVRIAAAAVTIAILFGASAPRVAAQSAAASRPAPAVTKPPEPAAVVAPATTIRVLLSPELETTLVAQMQGRITALNAGLGQAVAKGKPLISLECSEHQARLRMAEAEHVSARETLTAKKGLRELNAAGDVEISLAQAAVDRAKGAIDLAQSQIAYCQTDAPFSGRVAKIHVKPHQGVSAGMPLIELVSDGALKLRLNVPSNYLRSVKVGTGFRVNIDETGKSYAARITAINARVDAVAQTVEMEGSIVGRPPELLAGMSGVASFGF